jgi:signal transduction histidine kinase
MTTCFTSPKTVLLLLLLISLHLSVSAQYKQSKADSVRMALRTAAPDSNRVELLLELDRQIGYYDADTSLTLLIQARELSNKLNYKKGMAIASSSLGMLYMDLGQFDKSMQMINYAESTFIAINMPQKLAVTNSTKGNWYFNKSDYWNASRHYAKSAELFDKYGDSTNGAAVYQNLVSVLTQTKNYEKAIEISEKILDYARRKKDTIQMAYTIQGMTNTYIEADKLDEAKPYLDVLLVIMQNTMDNNIISESYNTAASYYYEVKDYKTALRYAQLALETGMEVKQNYQIADYKKTIGAIYLKMNQLALAKKYLDEAAVEGKASGNNDVYYNTTLHLSEYYAKVNDYPKAYEYLQQYSKLNDSLLVEETRQYTTQLEAVYESNKKETEILRLRAEDAEKAYAIRKRNTFLIITAGLLALLGFILALLIKNHRNRQRLSRQKAALQEEKIITMEKQQQVASLQSMINGQETERTRIARDLHDGLGGVFSTVKMHYSTLQHETPAVRDNPIYKKTLELINNAADELRKVAHNMMPEVLMKVGLIEALEDFCNMVSAGKQLRVNLQSYGMEKRLSSSTEVMLYRIIQELVNNIIKHANANAAIIQINRDGDRLSLTIEDNGKGFNLREAEEKQSMGMATVRSRVDYLNGKLTIDSRKGVGTTVMIDLLLNVKEN